MSSPANFADNTNFLLQQNNNNRNQLNKSNMNALNPNLNNSTKHEARPFGGGGDYFTQPFISDNASDNGYNMTPESYRMYMSQISAATPTQDNFNAISNTVEGTNEIFGPGTFRNNESVINDQQLTGRAADLSLCAQNMSTMASGVGASGIASSLLPNNGKESMTGFNDCNVQNVLANQTFLSSRSGGIIGTDTIAGSNRNANQSIRSEPPNPLGLVGPWNLSTIYPDLLRRPLEGCGPSFGLYGNGQMGSQVPVKMKNGI